MNVSFIHSYSFKIVVKTQLNPIRQHAFMLE